nr:hypothetical protein [Marinobacterium profundum]
MMLHGGHIDCGIPIGVLSLKSRCIKTLKHIKTTAVTGALAC